ncbi:hypothetical protein GCM10027020_17970 [Nocardioides salsibiostraticola]
MTSHADADAPASRDGVGSGLQVGEYELLARIGEGGMGIVHLARKPGGQRIALKLLRPQIVGDEEARHRLAREVGSLRRIRSRWVAEILDADPWAEIPFVATRYVPGLSLHDHVPEQGPIEGQDLLWFAGCLAEGIASVHEVGVLHRDIKPSNVLMEGRTPILIDFGLARVADDPKLTHTGWLLGTPGYLAPEILYGDEASQASDVHSWGATVAFAATGNPPFGRGPSVAIMDRVRRGEHRLDGLTGPLRDVVEAALDPEPSKRPSLSEILDWLGPQTTRPGPLLAPPPTAEGPRSAAEDMFTVPLALAAQAHGSPAEETVLETDPDDPDPYDDAQAAAPTRWLTTASPTQHAPPAPPLRPQEAWDPQSALATDWDPYSSLAPAVAPVGTMERVRRGVVLVAGAAATAVAFAAAPWVAAGVVVVLVWLLRGGSVAASVTRDRRRVRGAKWYDGPRLLLGAPWHLVRSLPGTAMLLLWSGGLALAAVLICYAASATAEVTLLIGGAVFVVSLWWGPGGFRVRSPLSRLVNPLSRTTGWWLLGVGVLLALAMVGWAVVTSQGVSWTPGNQAPFLAVR